MKDSRLEMDLCSGSILGKILLFTFPVICSNVMQLLFGAVNMVIVGRFSGDNALAAVGATTPPSYIILNIILGMSIGVNVCAANCIGLKNSKKVAKTVGTAVVFAVIIGLLLSIIGILGAAPILKIMDTPLEIYDDAVLYLRIYYLGMFPAALYNFGSALLRAAGDTRSPLIYLIVSVVANIVLNLLFVLGFHMSIAGVAIATVASQFIAAGGVIYRLIRSEETVHLKKKYLRIDKICMVKMFKIGMPAGLQSSLFAVSTLFIQSAVNSFGTITVTGNSAAISIENFLYAALSSFQQTAVSFVSQNLSAGNYQRADKITKAIITSVTVVGIGFGGMMLLGGRKFLGIYTDSPKVVEAGMLRLNILLLTYFLCGITEVLSGCLRSRGCSVRPMIITLLGVCGVRILILLMVFPMKPFHSIVTVYMTYPISWIATLIGETILYIYVYRKSMK